MRNALLLKAVFVCTVLLSTFAAFTQNLQPGLAAKFGIDGDLYSGERHSGNFAAIGSHDWFQKPGGTGLGLIDTTDAAALRQQILAGSNIAFSKPMQYNRYAVEDSVVLLDACYARDHMGTDKTSFMGNGTKNTASPLVWGTAPGGSIVSDKTDLIDSYVSMRRNGTVLTGSNAGNLVATLALSTLSTNGDHYVDFEFYKERLSYNAATGHFENTGPVAFGGHSLWEFNADGSVKSWGDMIISFSFNSSAVSDISVYIWVSQASFQQVNPSGFDFIAGGFQASTSVSGYGYAAIKPNGTGQIAAWGAVNVASVSAPLWGSNSKNLGSNSNNYFSDWYSAGQFAEAAVDLTSLGMDPASYPGMDACKMPFTRFMAKSRNSSSFSASLSDFSGPFDFLDMPNLTPVVAAPATLTCAITTATLTSASATTGARYSWTTNDGHVLGSKADSSSITVDKPGTYYLTAAIAQGCATTMDSVVVTEDKYKPLATARVTGMLYAGQTAQLYGGDTALSNYATPFGGSLGLKWEWTGPLGFYATWQNPITSVPGWHTLVVTEKRNGCKDTAVVYVTPYPTLGVSFQRFTMRQDELGRQNLLSWRIADAASAKEFLVERSADGRAFFPIARIPATANPDYSFAEPALAAYYRIKALDFSGKETFSPIVKAENTAGAKNHFLLTKLGDRILVHYTATQTETLSVCVFNAAGQLLWKEAHRVQAGQNEWTIQPGGNPAPGPCIVQIWGRQTMSAQKLQW